MKAQACLSKQSDEWATPKYIYSQAMGKGMFDPCPLGGEEDGLQGLPILARFAGTTDDYGGLPSQ